MVLILAAGTLAGCGCTSPIERDTPFARAIERRVDELSRTGPQGATWRVDELADFPWDRVYYFPEEYASYREINAAVGEKVFEGCGERPSFGQGAYLIFTRRGEVVHAVSVLAELVGADEQSYPRTVLLKATTRDPGPYSLELVNRR